MEEKDCLFCQVFKEGSRILFETEHFFVIFDKFPVNEGHALIISKRHHPDIFSVTYHEWSNEWEDLQTAILLTKSYLDKRFHPDGYNGGINCGQDAGQTVFHLHIHIVPRYKGDVINPRGGIRNFKEPAVRY